MKFLGTISIFLFFVPAIFSNTTEGDSIAFGFKLKELFTSDSPIIQNSIKKKNATLYFVNPPFPNKFYDYYTLLVSSESSEIAYIMGVKENDGGVADLFWFV